MFGEEVLWIDLAEAASGKLKASGSFYRRLLKSLRPDKLKAMEKILLDWSQVQATREKLMPSYRLRGHFRHNQNEQVVWQSPSGVVSTAWLGEKFHQRVYLEFINEQMKEKPSLILFPSECQNETE